METRRARRRGALTAKFSFRRVMRKVGIRLDVPRFRERAGKSGLRNNERRPNAQHKRQGRGSIAGMCLKASGGASPYTNRGPRPDRFMRFCGQAYLMLLCKDTSGPVDDVVDIHVIAPVTAKAGWSDTGRS